MNKKLLLSFAVFATALSVNAQKRGVNNYSLNGVKTPKHVSVVSDLKETNTFEEKVFSVNTNGLVSSKKRAVLTIVDTTTYFSSKRSYASPRTSATTLIAYPTQAGDSTELSTAYQIIPNNSQITMKGVRMQMVSLNKGAKKANVDVKVYSLTDGSTLAKSRKEIAYSASAYGLYDFIFDKPLVTNSNILVAIEPASETDSVQFPNSGGYRNSSISCNITGDQLTIITPAPTTNLGTSFWEGQVITGNGIAAGTTIKSFNSTTKVYTLSKAATTNGTNVVITGVNLTFDDQKNMAGMMYLKFPTVAGSQTKPDFTKKPLESPDALIWLNLGTSTAPSWKPHDANITMFPIVEYVFESTPDIDNKCLGDKNEVNITYKNTNPFNIAKNPLLNKMAFWTKYLGYTKKSGYFFSRVISSNDASFRDSIDLATATAAYKKLTYAAVDKNDTLKVYDLILPYGYLVNPGVKGFTSTFLLSSKISANLGTPSAVNCFADSSIVTISGAKGGYSPYTGTGDRKFAVLADSNKLEFKDANGCILKLDAVIKNSPKKLVATATVTDVKCFGDSAAVEVKATGGTGALTGVGIKKFTATAATSTQKIEVLDANKCKATVDATIKAAPAALVVTTKTTDATNNKTTDGTAEATVVGGTSPYTYAWDEKSTTAKITKTAGTFKVTVTDANGCKKEATAIIADKKVSITELGLKNVLVYPNPVINTLNVKFDASTIATVELVNVAGQVLNSEVSSDVTFNTSNLASGVYFVNIKVEEGVYTQKIIKE